MARISPLLLCLGVAAALCAGCNSDENSPDMGAVPPKPKADMISKMPPELQKQMRHASEGMSEQAASMGQKAKSAQEAAAAKHR